MEMEGDSLRRIAFHFPSSIKLIVIPNGAERNEESPNRNNQVHNANESAGRRISPEINKIIKKMCIKSSSLGEGVGGRGTLNRGAN